MGALVWLVSPAAGGGEKRNLSSVPSKSSSNCKMHLFGHSWMLFVLLLRVIESLGCIFQCISRVLCFFLLFLFVFFVLFLTMVRASTVVLFHCWEISKATNRWAYWNAELVWYILNKNENGWADHGDKVFRCRCDYWILRKFYYKCPSRSWYLWELRGLLTSLDHYYLKFVISLYIFENHNFNFDWKND